MTLEQISNRPEAFVAALVGAITIALTIVTILNNWIRHVLARKRDQRMHAASLYDAFYSVDGYRTFVAPVFEIMLKWNNLKGKQAKLFRQSIRDGWIGFNNEKGNLWRDLLSEDLKHGASKAVMQHFERIEKETLSEHESLTCFLYFWVKADTLMKAELVDRATIRTLFRRPFSYYRDFMFELRDDILKHISPDDIEPRWIASVEELDRFFAE